ncbi:uncharacterized protein [Typha angustifolia]|uniref:uncharacterized protein n=1 Tax=Typha angustifolia TaxID=59011 RepID=UPI003C2C3C6A
MQSNLFGREEEPGVLPSMKHQGIQRAYSDSLQVTDIIIKKLDETLNAHEAEVVVCECCGMSEDCTPTYISRIKETFCGKWVCGLCSEAVKEKLKRAPPLALDEALESHMSLCKKFNRTTRLNPKLSLAGAMREIANKSSKRRTSFDSCASKVARTLSWTV